MLLVHQTPHESGGLSYSMMINCQSELKFCNNATLAWKFDLKLINSLVLQKEHPQLQESRVKYSMSCTYCVAAGV